MFQVSRLIVLSWSWYTSSFLFPFYLFLSRMCSPISGGAGQASVPSSLPPVTSSQPAHLLAINSSNSKGKDRERPPLLPGCCHSCAFCYLIMLSQVCALTGAQTNLQIKKDWLGCQFSSLSRAADSYAIGLMQRVQICLKAICFMSSPVLTPIFHVFSPLSYHNLSFKFLPFC